MLSSLIDLISSLNELLFSEEEKEILEKKLCSKMNHRMVWHLIRVVEVVV